MCKWHKVAAKQAATNFMTQDFHAGEYAVALTAMGVLRVEQTKWQMAALYEIDGFNPKELLTNTISQAFRQSGLKKPMEDAQRDLAIQIAYMRHALQKLATECDLSPEALYVPNGVTQDGYKKTCCADPNPRDNGPFLDAAVVYLVKGYDDTERSYASGDLTLISAEELQALQSDPSVAENDRQYIPDLEAIRYATERFLSYPDIRQTLEDAFANTITVLLQIAQDDVDAGRGLTGASDCVMCEGAQGRKSSLNPV